MVLPNEQAKKQFLLELLPTFANTVGRTLVFVSTRAKTEELATAIRDECSALSCVESLHGDKHQSDRNKALAAFKGGHNAVLIATDVASRGLDVPHVATVINADVAKNMDTHCKCRAGNVFPREIILSLPHLQLTQYFPFLLRYPLITGTTK